MIQQPKVSIDTQFASQTDGQIGAPDRALEQALLDFARSVSENLAPDLVFRSDSSMPGHMLARHPDVPNQCYAIKRSTAGVHHAMAIPVAQMGSFKPGTFIDLYEGDDPGSAANWCKLHALLCHMDAPTFRTDAANDVFCASDGYMLTRDAPSKRWILSTTDGTPLGSWETPIHAEIIARVHRAYA